MNVDALRVIQNPKSKIQNLQRCCRFGQASLEMTLAMIGVLLLFLASLKVFTWLNGRLVARQQAYESSRATAAQSSVPVLWTEPAHDPKQKLAIFQ